MIKTIPHRCKFCEADVTVTLEDKVMKNEPFWLSLAACDRCADFMSAIRAIKDRVRHICVIVAQCVSEDLRDDVLGAAKPKLESATRKFYSLCNDYYHATASWNADIIGELLEHCRNSDAVLDAIRTGIKQEKRAAWVQ